MNHNRSQMAIEAMTTIPAPSPLPRSVCDGKRQQPNRHDPPQSGTYTLECCLVQVSAIHRINAIFQYEYRVITATGGGGGAEGERRGREASARPWDWRMERKEGRKERRGSRTNRLYTMPLLNDRPYARSSMFAHCVRSFQYDYPV